MKTILIALLMLVGSQAHAKGRGWFCYTAVLGVDGSASGDCERTQRACLDSVIMKQGAATLAFTLTGKTYCGRQDTAYSFTSYYTASGYVEWGFPTMAECKEAYSPGSYLSLLGAIVTRPCALSR